MELNKEYKIDEHIKKKMYVRSFVSMGVYFAMFATFAYFSGFGLHPLFLAFMLLVSFLTSFLPRVAYLSEVKNFSFILTEDKLVAYWNKDKKNMKVREMPYTSIFYCKIFPQDDVFNQLLFSDKEDFTFDGSDAMDSFRYAGKYKLISQGKHARTNWVGFSSRIIRIPYVPKTLAEEIRNYVMSKGAQDLEIKKSLLEQPISLFKRKKSL